MDPDDTILVCAETRPGSLRVPGTVRRNCELCNCTVDVAPTGQQMLRDQPDVHVVCVPCAMVRIKDDPDPVIAPITAAQLVEAFGVLRRN